MYRMHCDTLRCTSTSPRLRVLPVLGPERTRDRATGQTTGLWGTILCSTHVLAYRTMSSGRHKPRSLSSVSSGPKTFCQIRRFTTRPSPVQSPSQNPSSPSTTTTWHLPLPYRSASSLVRFVRSMT